MSFLAGKFMYGIKFDLHSRIFFIPWAKKNFIRSYSKERDHGSSFPVRYLPKKSSKANELKTSSPLKKGSEEVKEVRKSSEPNLLRVEFSDVGKSLRRGFVLDEHHQNDDKFGENITRGFVSDEHHQNDDDVGESVRMGFDSGDVSQGGNHNQILKNNSIVLSNSGMSNEIDHKWRPEEAEFMKEPEESLDELEVHQREDAHKLLSFEAGKVKQDAEKMAIGLLATRSFTAVELRKKLLGKKYSHEIVNAVVEDFQTRGFINDFLYAESFSRSRWSSRSWGPRRIKQALFEKGVSKVDAEKAIKLVLEDGEPGEDQVSTLGLSKLSMDHLISQASKQWFRGQDVTIEKRKSRIIMWLQYRGFNWGVINFVLKKLESKSPP